MSKWDNYDNLLELARAMWKHVWSQQAVDLPPDQFRKLFARIYDNCRDIPTLWQLGGATNDYLRIYPDALTVPTDLPTMLLNSNDIETRIIGLKLLNRCNISDELIISEIIRAMQRRDQYESCGGFYELGELLDRHQTNGSEIEGDLVRRLQQVLATFREDEDDDTRSSARHLLERLDVE